MKTAEPDFITDLDAIAIAAQREEIAFRENIAAEITKRERARQFAFRRLGLVRAMAAAAAGSENEDDAIARQLAALKHELDWHGDSEAQLRVLEAWRPVADAVRRTMSPDSDGPPSRDAVAQALAGFEDWYEAEHGKPFLSLLDVEIPEFPVVEF